MRRVFLGCRAMEWGSGLQERGGGWKRDGEDGLWCGAWLNSLRWWLALGRVAHGVASWRDCGDRPVGRGGDQGAGLIGLPW